jgi:hypothetical protein
MALLESQKYVINVLRGEAASRAAYQVCHTCQGQDKRAPATTSSTPRAALTWRGLVESTRTGSRGRGRGLRQTFDRLASGDGSRSAGKTFGDRLCDSVGQPPQEASRWLMHWRGQLGVPTGSYPCGCWVRTCFCFLARRGVGVSQG